MNLFDRQKETICAVATAPGQGAISVVRISGANACAIGRVVCPFLPKELQSHRAYYGFAKSQTQEIDEVIVTFFKEGRSFTGEETLEISCHGGDIISSLVIESLVRSGAIPANRGEFSFRAFLNNRIDLLQAESIQSLISSQSKRAAKLALRQLKGEVSDKLKLVETNLTWILAHLEANIDFATEDIESASQQELLDRASEVKASIQSLIDGYSVGRVLGSGLVVAFTGRPNVGKSSLMNLMLRESKAIVTDIPGTTRDSIEATKSILGVNVSFIDTAGIRSTSDKVEKLGIEKSIESVEKSDLQVLVLSCAEELSIDDFVNFRGRDPETVFVVANKVDIAKWGWNSTDLRNEVLSFLESLGKLGLLEFWSNIPADRFVSLSAETGENFSLFEGKIESIVRDCFSEDSAVISQQRHYEALQNSIQALDRGTGFLVKSESPEFSAFEYRESLLFLYEVLGQEFDEQVIDKIFQEFCLGK